MTLDGRMAYAVGDELVALYSITGRDDSYGHVFYACPGDHLIVRGVTSPGPYNRRMTYTYTVSKINCTDTFNAREGEVQLFRGVDEDLSNLAYSVTFDEVRHEDNWVRVQKILKLFKQKKHKGFYLEVIERANKRGYTVRVFKDV